MAMRRLILVLFLLAGAAAFGQDDAAADPFGVDSPVDDPRVDDPWGEEDDDWGDGWEEESRGWVPLSGFVEGAAGTRWDKDEGVGRYGTLLEARWRLESGWENDAVSIVLKGDVLLDGILEEVDLDLRDISIAFSPVDSLDMKIGRQVLTWGTGDLLFLNDLFPKDWVSFFAGRDDEYLKAPSNSFRMTQYNQIANVDFVWTPKFTPDEFIRGERFSFFSPFDGMIIGSEPPIEFDEPSSSFSNGEFSLRLFKTHKGVEYALYGYRGFFKTPSQITAPRQFTFAPMTSLGGSLRLALGPGLFNVEASYYFSRDDRDGTDPLVFNSQLRFLAGYEWEAARNFNVGLQYYLEHVADHDKLIDNSPIPQYEPPENRHTITTRLTYRAMQDKLNWSLFAFWSPNESDAYLRPVVSYRADDHWTMTFGLNLFAGDDPWTFLGQFQDNSNAYVRVRYNY
jgi:hypothetical protein